MKKSFKFEAWVAPETSDKCKVSKQMKVIIHSFYNLPCFFSRAKLKVVPKYRANHNNVASAIHLMEEVGMNIMQQDSVGTKQYYLGNFVM